jgi:hypothetical protein
MISSVPNTSRTCLHWNLPPPTGPPYVNLRPLCHTREAGRRCRCHIRAPTCHHLSPEFSHGSTTVHPVTLPFPSPISVLKAPSAGGKCLPHLILVAGALFPPRLLRNLLHAIVNQDNSRSQSITTTKIASILGQAPTLRGRTTLRDLLPLLRPSIRSLTQGRSALRQVDG